MNHWGAVAYDHIMRLYEELALLRAAHIVHLRVEHGLSIRRIARRVGIREKEVKAILTDHKETRRD